MKLFQDKNIIAILLSISIFSIIGIVVSANAFTLNPSSGTIEPNSETTINILANPIEGESAVTVYIDVEGVTVVEGSYSRPSGFLVVTEECESQSSFTTTNQVCVTLANSSDIASGESLGSFRVSAPASGTATINTNTQSLYSDGETNRSVTGTLGNYTIEASEDVTAASEGVSDEDDSSPSIIPDTAIEFDKTTIVALGVSIFILGIVVAVIFTIILIRNSKISMNDMSSSKQPKSDNPFQI